MAVLTLDQMKQEAIWNQINKILQANNVALSPRVMIGTTGMSFMIDIVPNANTLSPAANKPGQGGGPNG